jgi:TrmH family RNA methyltransferase
MPVIRDIAGRQNQTVRLARKLQHKKHRRERALMLCEGLDLLVTAVQAGVGVQEVLVRRDLLDQLPTGLLELARGGTGRDGAPNIGVCDPDTLEYASSLGGAVDVIFTCAQPRWSLADVALESGACFFLDGVGDPGNVGTIVRSALAFGWTGVTADPYGPKALRSGMGAQFLLPVVSEVLPKDLQERLARVGKETGGAPEVMVADPHGGKDVRGAVGSRGLIVVLGSERRGVGGDWDDIARMSVPQERFDSLNVAMAGTVIAYEVWRARQASAVGN